MNDMSFQPASVSHRRGMLSRQNNVHIEGFQQLQGAMNGGDLSADPSKMLNLTCNSKILSMDR